MKRLETRLEGPMLVTPVIHGDQRGFFHESYRRNVYAELGIPEEFVQDNHSRSSKGIVRGMHFQVGRAWRSSLLREGRGGRCGCRPEEGLTDLRGVGGLPLNDENLHHLYCPIGFAHGFCVTSDIADVVYKCDGYYDELIERGIAYDDPDIGIEWPKDVELVPSQRDANAPLLRDIERELPFVYERGSG